MGKAKVAFAGLAASGAGIGGSCKRRHHPESAMADVAKVVEGTEQQM